MVEMLDEMMDYWQERARSYSNGVRGELAGSMRAAWEAVLASRTAAVRFRTSRAGRAPRVIDLGCGPGMFSILFAHMGCAVTAVDFSENMLERAMENAEAEGVRDRITLACEDVADLPFSRDSFDIAVSRNVTWIMEDPSQAYREWHRVLQPGSKLLVFDANWYRYLVDDDVARRRARDQEGNVLEGWDEEAQATSDEEKRCEQLAADLPSTSILRPAWDVEELKRIGFRDVRSDEGIWKFVWPESEQRYYGATPMFLIEAQK